jgi:DNA-binding MarR family transcriptional regulator
MTSLISEFSYLLKKLQEIEKHFEVHTLTPNEKAVVHTMIELKSQNDACNITDVVEVSGISRSTVYKTIKKLTARNIISLDQSITDKRESLIKFL